MEDTAEHFNLSNPITEQLLSQAREQLAQARKDRPKPQRDDKIVTAWNGIYRTLIDCQHEIPMHYTLSCFQV